jgi:hypothetical protein
LYDEYLGILSKYKNLKGDQKESIGLCCLDATTIKYTKKDFASKIEIEIKRIQESIIGQCAKNIGVVLETNNIVVEEKIVVSSPEWSKADKELLAKDFLQSIAKYEHLTNNQREELSLCYISNTTSQITKKEYFDMIQIELRQLRETSTAQCAKNNNINLENIQVITNNVVSKENLVGSWRTDKGTTITFNENGTFLKTFHENIFIGIEYMHIQGQTTSGDWFLDGSGFLTLTEKWVAVETKLIGKARLWNESANGKFKIESLTKDFLKMTLIEGKSCCQEVNKPTTSVTQANKVK